MKVNLVKKAKQLRKTVLEICIQAGTGHVTSCFSCVEILVELFYRDMKPEDVFILSKGQASPLLYAILADKGLIEEKELWKFAQKDGVLGVHLDHHIPGAVITAGSLGHGLGIATGIAKARKLDGKLGIVYCLMGDGECYEGSVWEAAMYAGNEKLDNLVAIVDRNGLMVSAEAEIEPICAKFFAFGWIHRIGFGQPVIRVIYNPKGKGIPFMENQVLWHGVAPQGKDAERARRELDGVVK
ncbi:hypothetical protein LCGC14_1012880 [marine sediment metagenome]|uniref:Transketolase N-terminal domain-containing protein n=1 Tax=marine sediment metagenome TaxID=412755 RepID=A0A0F9N489_9ZZZZ